MTKLVVQCDSVEEVVLLVATTRLELHEDLWIVYHGVRLHVWWSFAGLGATVHGSKPDSPTLYLGQGDPATLAHLVGVKLHWPFVG